MNPPRASSLPPPDRLAAYAEVLCRIGLNRQRGQRVLVTDPYELQGVDRQVEPLVAAVQACCGRECEIVWSSPARVRDHAARGDWRGWTRLVATHAEKIADAIRRGDALLFLQGSYPGLFAGLPEDRARELRRISWEYFGPLSQALTAGATQWTAAPAPTQEWADAVYAERPPEARLPALWETVLRACRVSEPDPGVSWQNHLAQLQRRCAQLNQMCLPSLHYQGDGTDLRVTLPTGHQWRTACLSTSAGIPFVANLPTEEVFTVPDHRSTNGTLRVARPIHYAGVVLEGVELRFAQGRVIAATATRHGDQLQKLLELDAGAAQLGEVALIVGSSVLRDDVGRLYHHPLLDENAAPHVALGESYAFCLRGADDTSRNRSLIHVDLPLAARVFGPPGELA